MLGNGINTPHVAGMAHLVGAARLTRHDWRSATPFALQDNSPWTGLLWFATRQGFSAV